MSKTILFPAAARGHANHGWLDTFHSFSFAGYYNPDNVHFGMLRVLNDDTVKGGSGFGMHPHDNMEIITIVLRGALEHKDTMGHTKAIHAGEVQVMSAGSGLYHSEYNHNVDSDVELFQIWIYPKVKNINPRYDQVAFDELGRLDKFQLLVSPIDSKDAGLKIYQDAWIYRTIVTAGNSLTHNAHSSVNGLFIMVVSGDVVIDGQPLGRRDAIGISDVTAEVTITANGTSDVLIVEVPMR